MFLVCAVTRAIRALWGEGGSDGDDGDDSCSLFDGVSLTQHDAPTCDDEGSGEGRVEYKVDCVANVVVDRKELISPQMSGGKLKGFWRDARREGESGDGHVGFYV